MTNYAYLVDWQGFAAAWEKGDASNPDWFWDARDEGAAWVGMFDLWCASPISGGQMAEVYDKLRGHVPARSRKKLDKLFGAFFWPHEIDGHYTIRYVQDLIARPSPDVFAGAMRPATVRRYLARWDEAGFERMRRSFHDEFPVGLDRVADFGEFKRYAEMWVELLRAAAEAGRGIVVDMC